MTHSEVIDQARAVRDEDAFDVARMHEWLRAQISDLPADPPAVSQFSSGASNLTYLLAYSDRELILRRPPAGHKAASAHDMAREYHVQQALKPVYPYVPRMLALCQESAVMGCDFYVMERLRGIIPRANMPRGLELTPEQTRTLCRSVIDRLIELHQVDYQAAGLEHIGKGAGYVKRQIEGWSDRYRQARTWNVPGWARVMHWLHDNMPDDVATVVIHNDFRFDNVVLDPNEPARIIGVLDWEMATLGDPLMDLGNSLAYWVQADDDFVAHRLRRQPTHLPGMFTRREVVDYYCERMNMKPDNWAFYEVYGLFRLAVIAQQIYYRYHHRQTSNPQFRIFWVASHYLQWRCKRLIREAGYRL